MCLLVSQPEGTVFDDDFLHGVYLKNSDGIGVMFSDGSRLNILRCVPNSEEDFIAFFKKNIEGKACAWHARMRTHGDIDLLNCHPYQVLSADDGYPIYLAHNGVLSTGNAKDHTKSDTWHYIQDFLRPMLLKNPEFFMHPAFKAIVESHIGGGNKFVLMDAYGNSVTINERAGVSHNGAWLSNTYAWDVTGTKFDYKSKLPTNYGYSPAYAALYGTGARGFSYAGAEDDEYESFYQTGDKNNLLTNDEAEAQAAEAAAQADAEAEAAADAAAEIEDEANARYAAVEFATELFLEAREMDMLLLDLSWDDVENYYHYAGRVQAYDVIECVGYGAYTEEELIAEIKSASDVIAEEDEAEFVQNLLDQYGATAANDTVAAA